jgi:signal peptidase I
MSKRVILSAVVIVIAFTSLNYYTQSHLKSYRFPGESMAPVLEKDDRVFVNLSKYKNQSPVRGDIIVFIYPPNRAQTFAKRVVGLPGDKVQIISGKIHINGQRIESTAFPPDRKYLSRDDWAYGKEDQIVEVPEGMYYVLGDQTDRSSDSRQWGFIPAKDILGKVVMVYWPPLHWKFL